MATDDTPSAGISAGARPSGEPDRAVTRKTEAHARIKARREAALEYAGANSTIKLKGEWREFTEPSIAAEFIDRKTRTGIALSGGGIRSATISLGLIEALASRGRFYGFDLMSTVSGGGYCGSFVRSLFIDRPEGDEKGNSGPVLTDRTAFADATLTSYPDQQYFRGKPGQSAFVADGKTVKNPLWWLRENGRYLAPGGMSDYGYALSYIVRNWVSLLIFTLACMMVVFAAVQFALYGLVEAARTRLSAPTQTGFALLESWGLYSPLLAVVALMALIGTSIAAGYWLTLPLSFARDSGTQSTAQRRDQGFIAVAVLLSLLGGIFALRHYDLVPHDAVARSWAAGLIFVLSSALLFAFITWCRTGTAVDFRREHTRLLAGFSVIFLVLCAVAAIDCAALALRRDLDDGRAILGTTISSGVLASIVSFLIAKLPDWIGGDGGKVRSLLVRHANQAALLAGIVILAAIALLADLLVIKLLWHLEAWTVGYIDLRTAPALGVILALTLLFGCSVNFANLLALTPFYGSRLTRAYLGGSNAHRLEVSDETKSDVTHGMLGDDIPLRDYMEADGPAPLHLINVTRNRTVGDKIARPFIDVVHDDPLVREDADDPRGRLASYESSLTLHDRHGDRMVFGPFGMRVGAEYFDWSQLKDVPSLGLLCAISGAAVGSGMGRLTSLGTAMALTLANVRLGFWWKARDAATNKPSIWRQVLPALGCLLSELLGRFGTKGYWLLSDGGHSENSGALSLLERGCNLIVVADNAQDTDYAFGDLEILIRTARTDIGMEVSVVADDKFPESLQRAKACFFNAAPGDWRKRVKKQDDQAFALLLKAADIPRLVDGKWKQRHGGQSWIVWFKPNRIANLPADIATYAELQPDFPQQSTANQFFDEGQWESYRRLGFEMGRRLFADHETLAEYLPVIYREN